jgi:hypothetical protein
MLIIGAFRSANPTRVANVQHRAGFVSSVKLDARPGEKTS